MEEREKTKRVMCLIRHVSNFDWGNGRNGIKFFPMKYRLLFSQLELGEKGIK